MIAARAPRASTLRTTLALARAEGVRALKSPFVLIGLGMAVAASLAFATRLFGSGTVTWSEDGWPVHVGIFLLALFTMVAMSQATLRDRKERTTDQHGSAPLGPAARVGGTALATLWPALVGGVLFVAVAGLAAMNLAVPGSEVAGGVQRVVVIVMMGTLGIAIAAWFRHPVVAAIVAVGFVVVHPGEVPSAWDAAYPLSLLSGSLAWWHVAYLFGLACLFALAAMVRFGPDRRVVVGMVGSAALAAVSLAVVVGGVCPHLGRCAFV